MKKYFEFLCVLVIACIGLMGCSSSSDKSYELVHSHRTTIYVSEHPIKFSYTTQDYGWHITDDFFMTVNGQEITDFEIGVSGNQDSKGVHVTIYKEYEIGESIEVYLEVWVEN
ncbi:MAG: hypothetical protein LUF85_06555 [Bacteroides sp.]|nr:hypothetical protein [Bacteroides sp.]